MDFGCILNDTEVTRYVNITNNSPMEVKYRLVYYIGLDTTKPVLGGFRQSETQTSLKPVSSATETS